MNRIERNNKILSILAVCFILVLFAVSAFFAAEIATRVFFSKTIEILPKYHSVAKYGDYTIRCFRPGLSFWHTSPDGKWLFKINDQGFRGSKNYYYRKENNPLRILILGDSNAVGFETDQEKTFPAILESYLNNHDIKAEVLNTSIADFGTAEEYVFFANEGIKYSPDVVVLAFSSDDLNNNVHSGLFIIKDGKLAENKKSYIPYVRILDRLNDNAIIRWLNENSYFCSMVIKTLRDMVMERRIDYQDEKLERECLAKKECIDDYKTTLAEELIKKIYEACRQNNIKLVILDLPQFDALQLSASSMSERLKKTAKNNSDLFIDGLEKLGDYRDMKILFMPNGKKYISEFAHVILGVAIAKEIESLSGKTVK